MAKNEKAREEKRLIPWLTMWYFGGRWPTTPKTEKVEKKLY